MALLTFAQLLGLPTATEVRDRLFALLNKDDFPITDYHVGAVVRTLAEASALAIADFILEARPRIVAGVFSQLAAGDWLTYLAAQNYNLERRQATYTVQSITAIADVGVGPFTVAAGEVIVESEQGNRYILDEGGTIPVGTATVPPASLPLRFKAESPGARYNDGANTITRVITGPPAVKFINSPPTFSVVEHEGTGPGEVFLAGSPVASARYSMRITASGEATIGGVGAATFEFSKDGAPYVPGGACVITPATVTLDTGVTVRFVNGGAAPSFIQGDRYVFSIPGSPILEQGRDDETDDALRARIRSRWPSLAQVETADKYELWAKEAAAEVTKVTVRPANSAATPGRVEIIIAGASNTPLSGATQTVVQNFIDDRAGITEAPVVVLAESVEIQAQGTVTVRARDLAAVQVAAQAQWAGYVAALALGGKVYASELVQALMDAGAIDFSGILVKVPDGLGGFVTGTVVELGSAQVARVHTSPVALLLTWATI